MNINKLKINSIFATFLGMAILFTSCKDSAEQSTDEMKAEQTEVLTYTGDISSLNANYNNYLNVSGAVNMEVKGDLLTISVRASDLEPNMMHLQMLHGTKDGSPVNCPDISADINNDLVIDVTELAKSAGITMIPLHDDPANMKIKTDTYPKADSLGNLSYTQTVSMKSLRNAFKNEFGMKELDLTKFTYIIHGVDKGDLPESAASVMDVPAHVTLPVGCTVIPKY